MPIRNDNIVTPLQSAPEKPVKAAAIVRADQDTNQTEGGKPSAPFVGGARCCIFQADRVKTRTPVATAELAGVAGLSDDGEMLWRCPGEK
jgi:hypothetical protein